jgi:hypothetical protein
MPQIQARTETHIEDIFSLVQIRKSSNRVETLPVEEALGGESLCRRGLAQLRMEGRVTRR